MKNYNRNNTIKGRGTTSAHGLRLDNILWQRLQTIATSDRVSARAAIEQALVIALPVMEARRGIPTQWNDAALRDWVDHWLPMLNRQHGLKVEWESPLKQKKG